MFVALNGDVFVDNGENSRIEIWSIKETRRVEMIAVNKSCYGLFVDLNNTIYCSMRYGHKVVTISPNIYGSYTFEITIGDDQGGSGSGQLNEPNGIFVDENFTLYVADSKNNRIQRFQPGETNGTTVASNETEGEHILDYPTGIILDADQNMFILNKDNHRIIRWGPDGRHCLLGCSSNQYSAADQKVFPQSLSFDSYGNIFIAGESSARIMKFTFITNSCSKCILFIGLKYLVAIFLLHSNIICIKHYKYDCLSLCFII